MSSSKGTPENASGTAKKKSSQELSVPIRGWCTSWANRMVLHSSFPLLLPGCPAVAGQAARSAWPSAQHQQPSPRASWTRLCHAVTEYPWMRSHRRPCPELRQPPAQERRAGGNRRHPTRANCVSIWSREEHMVSVQLTAKVPAPQGLPPWTSLRLLRRGKTVL